MDISSRKPYRWHLYWRNAKACYLRKHFLVFILPWGRGKIKWKEGAFADVKADRNHRRFLIKGHVNVEAETILLAMAHNIFKLHCKIQAQRLGVHLIQVVAAA